ncbi:MAG: hypothetical protein ACT4P1_07015 [Sporichthyaceae bacterium]
MASISLRTDAELDNALARIQADRGLATRSDAIRVAILEADRRLTRAAMQEREITLYLAAGPDPDPVDPQHSAESTNAAWADLDDTDWEKACAPSTS